MISSTKHIDYFSIPGLKDKQPIRKAIPERIIEEILKYRNQTLQQLLNKSHKREFVYTRHLISYFLVTYSSITLSDIGKFFDQDHTTVIYGRRTLKNLLDVEPSVQNDYNIIYNKIFESED